MAQTGYTPIQLYYSTTASAVPTNTNLANGELAINITDGKLYYKDNTGTVKLLTSTGSEISPITNNGVVYINGSGQATSGSALTFDGTNLGIGNTSPTSYNSAADNLVIGSSGSNGMTIVSGSTSAGYIMFADGTTGQQQYEGQITYDHTSNFMAFNTSATEGMRLTSTGLGIGTSSPANKLHVQTSTTGDGIGARISTSDASGVGSQAINLGGYLGGNQGVALKAHYNYGATNATSMSFWTTNAAGTQNEGMRLDSAGNLGLGVTPGTWSDGKVIEINTAGNALWGESNYTVLLQNARYNGGYKYARTGVASSHYDLDGGSHKWYTAPSGTAGNAISFTQAMTLDASGNLVVADTTPAFSFSGRGNITIGGTTGSLLGFRVSSVNKGYIYHDGTSLDINNQANGFMSFSTNATERARIDSSGNFSIGTTDNSNILNLIGQSNGGGISWTKYMNVFSEYSSGAAYISSNYYPTYGASGYKTTLTASFGAAGISISGTGGASNGGLIAFYVDTATSKTAGAAFTPTERLRIAETGAIGLSGANYGSSGQVLTSQGSGSPPIWAAGGGGGGSPGGSNTQVQYNSSGSFAGSANFTFNGTGITTGFFAPSSSSAPATGISLSSADTLGFSSASQGNAMFFKTFQIGSSGAYVNQLSIGNGINTSYYSNLYVYAVTSTAAQAKSTDGPGQLYSGNNNIPYRANQVIEAATSGFTSNQYCPVGLESVSRSSGGWQPTQFPTGSFQTFTNIGVYGEAQGASGYPLGAGFYAFAGSYYANATGFYARTYNIAPTSGSSFCYRADIGPHVFGGGMVGYHSRVVSGQGGNSTYNQTIGWWHSDETANGVGGIAARFEKAGTVVGTITLTTSATSYNTSSDPRLKDISGPVTSDEAKAFVMGLQPKQGTWKADGSRFCGFLSTDYELIDPSGVSGVAGATEVVGNLIDKDGKVINEDVVEPTPDALPEGGRWERTRVRDIYQTLEYGSAAWCANMTAHAQYLQTTIEQLVNRISALENK